jgi:hypothetical protein
MKPGFRAVSNRRPVDRSRTMRCIAFDSDARPAEVFFESRACESSKLFSRASTSVQLIGSESSRTIQEHSSSRSSKRLRSCRQKTQLSGTFIKIFLEKSARGAAFLKEFLDRKKFLIL